MDEYAKKRINIRMADVRYSALQGVSEVDVGIETGRDECVAEHVGMRPGDLDTGGFGKLMQTAGGRVPVHPGAAAVEQDRPARAAARPRGRWRVHLRAGPPCHQTGLGTSVWSC